MHIILVYSVMVYNHSYSKCSHFNCTPFFVVPLDENGIIPDELERVLEATKQLKPCQLTEKHPFWGMLYLISTFHNPTGVCLSAGE